MRFSQILILSLVVLFASGCRMPRRTSKRPVYDALSAPVHTVKNIFAGKERRIANSRIAQPVTLHNQAHFEGSNCQVPMVDNCGCLPSEIVEFDNSQPSFDGVENLGFQRQSAPNLELEPEKIEPAKDFDSTPTLDGLLIPENAPGLLDDQSSNSYDVGSTRKSNSNDFQTDASTAKQLVKALPVSTVKVSEAPAEELVEEMDPVFESKPTPFSEMGKEEAKEEATIELPASINLDESTNQSPIVLRAYSSRYYQKHGSKNEELISDPAGLTAVEQENELRQQQADAFGLPKDHTIQFSNLPPMDDDITPPVRFDNNSNSQPDLESLPRIEDAAPTDQTAQVQQRSNSYYQEPPAQAAIQTAAAKEKHFVVESTATYQPQERAKTEILRLSAVTGSGSKVVDRRGNVARLRMESPVVVYASKDPKGTQIGGQANRVAEEEKTSKARILDR